MKKQITIIGLGQIGASVGLALAPYKSSIKRVGHDKTPGTARSAQALGAVDEINFNLPASVRAADIVLLAVPFSELEETFKFIGDDLKPGAVVLDTAPVKAKAAEWAEKYISAGRSYVGLVPSIGPDHLLNVGAGQSASKADLFHQALFLVCPARNTAEAEVKRATDLLELLGASPLFSDPFEADGLMAALHTLPQLLSLSLLNATTNQPGWKEARKMAGRPYGLAAAAALYLDQAEAVTESVRCNRVNVIRVLDNAIRSLAELRAALNEEDIKSAGKFVDDAYLGGMQWLKDRLSADWDAEYKQPIEISSFSERLLGTWLRPGKQK
ncbi:MAG: Cyclohexadienyl dehydrogenase [Anaerolineales bacterium]|nr:Cyclohexadienyl dehydrogenase [Anaerolineales bacterium]